MGAAEFTVVQRAKTAQEAFSEAQREARHLHGHGGYTGTIAEKHGFKLAGMAPTVADALAKAAKFHEAAYDRGGKATHCDKWGDCGCIEVPEKGELKAFVFFGVAAC